MPRKRQWPPKVHNHKGSARARGLDNKYHYFGPYGSEEAVRNFAEWIKSHGRPKSKTRGDNAQLSVTEVLEEWWAVHQPKLSPNELRNYEIVIRALKRTHGDVFAKDFDSLSLEEFQEALGDGSWHTADEKAYYKHRRIPLDLSRKVINRRTVRVKTIWRWLERKKKVPKGSHANLSTVRALSKSPDLRETPGVDATDYADLLKVAQHCPDAVAAMLEIQWWCGMRSGEVRIMRTRDVDQSGDVWLYRPSKHKNDWRGQVRIVPIPPEAQKILAPWLKPDDPEAYLFTHARGIYTDYSYPQAVRRAREKAGVPNIKPYGGRHAAKDRIVREHGLDVARAFLGQKSIQTTDGYGSQLDLDMAKEAAKKKDAG